jgi:hypothetical protein
MKRAELPKPLRACAKAAVLLAVLSGACAHTSVKSVGDCDRVPSDQRVACAACTVKNEAGGLLGGYEYRPDNDPADRCVKAN